MFFGETVSVFWGGGGGLSGSGGGEPDGAHEYVLDKFLNTTEGCTLRNTTTQQSAAITINHLTPNGHYMGRTTQLTSRSCILYIYSTNIRTEYFKHAA